MENIIKRYRPVPFFALYFLLSWVPFWFAGLAARQGQPDLANLIFIAGGIGAAVTPLIMIYAAKDPQIIHDYWRRIVEVRRVNSGGWIAVLLTIPVLTLGAVAISTLFGASWDQLRLQTALTAAPLAFILWTLIAATAEEIALRGYGLDSLRERMNQFKASALLGVLWIIWHVPLVFWPGTFQNQLLEQPLAFVGYWAWMIPTTIFYSWLFYRNSRSTLAAILFHFMTNFIGESTGMGEIARFAQAVLMIMLVVGLVYIERGLFFHEELEVVPTKTS
jgi:uncharacterized protein